MQQGADPQIPQFRSPIDMNGQLVASFPSGFLSSNPLRMVKEQVRAFWITGPCSGALRQETLPDPGPGELRLRSLYSAISRGTESLVYGGHVPPSQYRAMRAPHQAGDFPAPVKYGYSTVGMVADGPPDLRGRRVLDVGCGFADFADYLAERHPGVVYEGVDITPRMIEEARRLHPGLSLRVLDILDEDPGGPYDLVTANGIFYLIADEAEARMRRLIARMYALTRGAVAFNTHSGWAPYREADEFYPDPLDTVAFCRTLTPWVALRHDYMGHDFTAYLYREPGGRRG